ncbi:MAG: pilus assembly protein PilM [Candidatus Neomarinimicrobiota bacterium]
MPKDKKDKKEAAANKLLKVLRDRDVEAETEKTPPPESPTAEVTPEHLKEDDAEELIGVGRPRVEEEPFPDQSIDPVSSWDRTPEEDVSIGTVPPNRVTSRTKKEGISAILHEIIRYVNCDKVVTGVLVEGGMFAVASVEDQKGTKRLVDFAATQMDPDLVLGGDDERQQAGAEIVGKLLSEKNNKQKSFFTLKEELSLPGKVVSCFPEAVSVVKDVELPSVGKKELADAIEWNAKKDLPFAEEKLIIDHIKQPENGAAETGGGHNLVGVSSEESINDSVQVMIDTVGVPRKIAPAAYAAWSAFVWNYPEFSKDDTIVIHIGETKTVVLFISGKLLRFVREIQLGGIDFSKAIPAEITLGSDRVVVTPRMAEKLRQEFEIPTGRTQGSDEDEARDSQLMPHFRNTLERFVGAMTRAFNVHRKEFPMNRVKRIFLTGSGAALGNLSSYLSEALGKKVLLLDPVRMLLGKELLDDGGNDNMNSLHLSIPIGLALNIHRGINLLPKRLRREELFLIVNHVGRKVLIALFVLFLSLSGMTQLDLLGTRTQLDIQEKVESQLTPIKHRYDTLIQELTEMGGYGGMVESDRRFHEKEVAILKMLSNVTPREIFLTYLGFREGWVVSESRRVGRATVTDTEIEASDEDFIRMEGLVATNPALQEAFLGNYIATLESNGLFANISIVDKRQDLKQRTEGLSFVLKCQL